MGCAFAGGANLDGTFFKVKVCATQKRLLSVKAVMETINLSPQALLTSPYKKKKTLQKYNRFKHRLLQSRLWASHEWPCTWRHFLLSTTAVLINEQHYPHTYTDEQKKKRYSRNSHIAVHTVRSFLQQQALWLIDKFFFFLWAGWMKAHSLVHNNMESFSLIWHWTDDPVTACCSTSKHSMFSVLLHFISSYNKMRSCACVLLCVPTSGSSVY